MGDDQGAAQSDRVTTIANIALLSLAVVSIGFGVFVYTDRDGPGRTQDGIVAADFIEVSASVSGPIVELSVHDNQRVEAGAPLFKLDDRPYKAAVEVAKGAHEEALAELADKQALYERTAAEAKAGGVVSRQQLEDAKAARDGARGSVTRTAGQLAAAEVDLAYCDVVAPFDGIVTGLVLQVGQYVEPGTTLFSLIDAESFHVVAYMKEQNLGPVAPGAQAEIELWQYPDKVFPGKVESVGRGIHAREFVAGLQVVEKTLDWVQLAARVPVRITIETDEPLVMGATAHVRVR